MRRVIFYLFIMSTFIIPASAEDGVPQIKDMLEITIPGSPMLSPDGTAIIYTKRMPDWDANQFVSQVYLIDVATGESRKLTNDKDGANGIAWSPDGRFVSYLASRDGGKTQVWLLPMKGGEPYEATKSETGVRSYRWRPDGKAIAYTDADPKSEEEKKREETYGSYTIHEEDGNLARLRLQVLETDEPKTLVSRDDQNVTGFIWSPDGKRIAVNVTPDFLLKSFSHSDIWVYNFDNETYTALVDLEGPDNAQVFSPDGSQLLISTQEGETSYLINSKLALVPAEGGDIRVLQPDFNETLYAVDWNETGIWVSAYQEVAFQLFVLDPENGLQLFTPDDGNRYFPGTFDTSAQTLAFTMDGPEHFREIYVTGTDAFQPRKLSSYSSQIAEMTLSTKENIWWKSSDGTDIHGVLSKPADFNPETKYPLFVVVHGGPSGISTPSLYQSTSTYYPMEQWAGKGALVLQPNYRGSIGFGQDFRKLNYRNLGLGDYEDVISGVDFLISEGIVDPERVCVMGWSQGGYISAFCTTFSDRFLAVSVGAGISDWVDYYYRTDITPFTMHYLGDNPWNDPDIYDATSPMHYIRNAETPTLIQHGSNDARVPVNNAYKLYRGLKDQGVDVRLILYNGFGHGINKPKERLAVATHNWQWFGRHVWGEEPEIQTEKDETSGK